MGSYLYRAFGKSFSVNVDGVDTPARLCKFWCKPWYDIFDAAAGGGYHSWWSDSEKRIWRNYKLQLGRLDKSEKTLVLILNNNPDRENNYNRPAEGDRVLLYQTPKNLLWDDPDWGGASIRKLHKGPTGWEAVP